MLQAENLNPHFRNQTHVPHQQGKMFRVSKLIKWYLHVVFIGRLYEANHVCGQIFLVVIFRMRVVPLYFVVVLIRKLICFCLSYSKHSGILKEIWVFNMVISPIVNMMMMSSWEFHHDSAGEQHSARQFVDNHCYKNII